MLNRTLSKALLTALAVTVSTGLSSLVFVPSETGDDGIGQLSSTAGFVNSDTDPAHGSLGNFSYTGGVGVDYQRRSVGADLGLPQQIRRLELVAEDDTSRLTQDDYTLWVSDDNNTYEQVDDWTFKASVAGNALVHTFSGVDVTARYIKVNTRYEDADFTFLIRDFQRNVRVYGVVGLPPDPSDPVDIGQRLQLMVDDHMIGQLTGDASLQIHQPVRQGTVMTTDKPWEGSASHYRTVFQDGDIYRMYYLGLDFTVTEDGFTSSPFRPLLYAESDDGIHWNWPNLGRVEFDGSTDNNILLEPDSFEDHGLFDLRFADVFKDTNPLSKTTYKALAMARAGGPSGLLSLYALESTNGLDFELIRDEPIWQSGQGGLRPNALDSQNIAFWDSARGEYRVYMRDDSATGVMSIRTAASPDFLNWSAPEYLEYPGARLDSHMYTQPIVPYDRAPHLFVGFPMRYQERELGPSYEALPNLEHRQWRYADTPRYGTAVTDALFMTSRDGVTFNRPDEAFIRPGLGEENWKYGDNSVAHGIVTTSSAVPGAPDELSIYATEGYWTSSSLDVVRYSMRVDGFGSIHAGMGGGALTTKPLLFSGDQLVLNYATSAAGGIRVEILDADGAPIPGFTLADNDGVYGDSLERVVSWNGESDLSDLAGQPVRLRFVMTDADLYSLQVRDSDLVCDATVTGDHTGPLKVSDGTTCLDEATVTGPVTVEPNASLVSRDSILQGGLSAEGAAAVVVCGTSIRGPVSLTGGSTVVLGNPDDYCIPNAVDGLVRIVDNHGNITLAGNTIDGPLACLRNDPAPGNAGKPNTVSGSATGQCTDL